MRFHSARQVIHDAFIADITAIDTEAVAQDRGIQFTARGATNRIMDHCEKGIIQQALAVQKENDELAWAWNMFAYAPPGSAGHDIRGILLSWLIRRFAADQGGGELKSGLAALARIAMHDVALEDVTGTRCWRRSADVAPAVGVDADEFDAQWRKHYVRLRGYCRRLPERSLPPIANVLWIILDKQDGVPGAAEDLRRMLRIAE